MRTIAITISALLLFGCGATPEQIDAQARAEQQRFEMQQQRNEAAHQQEIEKIEAMGGANYADQQAAANRGMTVGEGAAAVTAIGAGAWIFGKILDGM